MSKESTLWKRTQIERCTNSPTAGHCWHFAGHNHATLDKCCFCLKSGEIIFGGAYNKEKQAAAIAEKKKK